MTIQNPQKNSGLGEKTRKIATAAFLLIPHRALPSHRDSLCHHQSRSMLPPHRQRVQPSGKCPSTIPDPQCNDTFHNGTIFSFVVFIIICMLVIALVRKIENFMKTKSQTREIEEGDKGIFSLYFFFLHCNKG